MVEYSTRMMCGPLIKSYIRENDASYVAVSYKYPKIESVDTFKDKRKRLKKLLARSDYWQAEFNKNRLSHFPARQPVFHTLTLKK